MFWLLRLSSLTNNQISRFSWLIIHTKADVKKKKMFQRYYIYFLRFWEIYHDFYQYLPKMINFVIIDSISSKMRSSINYNAFWLFKIDYCNIKHLDGTKKFYCLWRSISHGDILHLVDNSKLRDKKHHIMKAKYIRYVLYNIWLELSAESR